MHRQHPALIAISLVLVLLVAGSVHGAPSGNIIYVKHDATGSNNGSSWDDAYTDLQDALGVAQASVEIWVAEGVYYPAPTAIDRTATFELQDGVALYGGFAGTETERDQRDWEANVTVLSGDLDRNDSVDQNGVVTDTVGILGRNAYHVVTADGIGETTDFDGFTVTAGLADTTYGNGGGMYAYSSDVHITNVAFIGNKAHQSGGGLSNADGSPTLHHVTFTSNNSDGDGGGIYNGPSGTPRLWGVTFTDNKASDWGGGFHNRGNSTLSDVAFTGNEAGGLGGGMYNYANPVLGKVVFSENRAGRGGGMFHTGYSPTMTDVILSANQATDQGGGLWNNSDLTLDGVLFAGNQAGNGGGGMYSKSNPALTNAIFSGNQAEDGGAMYNTEGDASLTNVTFSGNKAVRGGGVYNRDTSPVLANCILWANAAQTGPQVHNEGTSAPYVIYSDIEGGYSGEGNINADPLFVDPISASQAPTTAGDYRLSEGSPAIDAGTNDVVTVDTDLDGNPRIVDGTGDGSAIVDMGAYEFQIPLLSVIKQGQGLVTSTPTGIDCGSACTAGFLPGTVVTLAKTPDTGWTFSHWSGDCMGTGTCQVTMDDDKSVTAHFTQEEYTLEIDVVGEGDVDRVPDQYAYHYGDVVMLTANAQPGWTFESWTGDVESTDNPLELTIEDNTVITATFTQDEYTLNVSTVGEGTVTTEPQQETYIYGDVVTLTATAEAGWSFIDWSGDVESTDNPLVLGIQDDTALIATFTQHEYTLAVSTVGEGSVDIEPNQEKYVHGDEVTLTPAADPGWTFDAWSGPDSGDLSDNSDGSWNLVIDADKSVTATFTQHEYTLDVAIVGEGEVAINPEQDTYVYADVVTLTATASPGWSFAAWSGDVESTDNPLDFVVEGDTVITATFTEEYKKVHLPLVLANR